MMLARRSRGARDTSSPIRLDISLVCRCIPLTSKIETALFLSSAQFARSIPGYATSSLTAPMRATSSRTPCPNSEPGLLKSSNDPIPRKASRFCRVDGLSREHSHGSTDAAGSPKTSRPPSQARLPGFSSPISAALRGGSQGLESNQVFISRTLSLTLADSGGVSESIFHALPDMVRNFYTVSAWPGHERNLMVPNFAADRCDRVAEGQDRFWIPCGGSRLELLRFIEIVCPECYD